MFFKSDKEKGHIQIYTLKPLTELRRIICAHDECTVRSGEVQEQRWLNHEYSPLFNEGRGGSKMLSDFIIRHPFMPLFSLTEDEWRIAINQNHG